MNCAGKKMQEFIAAYVLGILNNKETTEVKEHLAGCKKCNEYAGQLFSECQMLKDYSDMLDADIDARKIKMIEALNTSATKMQRSIFFWRTIMKSKVAKTAVAAMIMMIVMLGGYCLTGSLDGSGKVYAMSDLPELLYSARTVHMKGIVYHTDNLNPGDTIPSDMEILIDLENKRWRRLTANVVKDKKGTRISQMEFVCDGGAFDLGLDHKNRTASYTRLSNYWRKRLCRQITNSIMQLTCGDLKMLDLYEITGSEEIDGETYEIWELVIENNNNDPMSMNVKMQSWLSPVTGDLAQAIVWMKPDGRQWQKMTHVTDFDMNFELSKEAFVMEAPEEYEFENTMKTAYKKDGLGGVICGTGKYYLQGHILFALGDSSIIACWSSRNPESDESQADLFKYLEFGGEMPRLPSIVEGLKTSVNSQEITFNGRHLGYTQKDGKFYEWGLYAAEQSIERRLRRVLPYQLLYKTNGKEDSSCRMSMIPDMLIENSVDFDEYVLTAMAELSDESKVTESITYEMVLELAEIIRISNK